ncbi:hypothetical protein VCHA38O209_50040 [Vibrio chagasii]|nr:hypothetical protein VCHA38O209_50040 [Vibrio chagasii]
MAIGLVLCVVTKSKMSTIVQGAVPPLVLGLLYLKIRLPSGSHFLTLKSLILLSR